MPDDAPTNLPALETEPFDLGAGSMPPSLRVLLDPRAFDRCEVMARMMSQATGITPAHLVNKTAACHVVINMALDWKLSPHFVARHTYQTPGGAIGFEGALVQAILQQSGRLVGAPRFEYRGDWSKVQGKFIMATGAKGGQYPRATWTDQDAIGCGIRVVAQIKGEKEPRYWPGENDWFDLVQCQPRNSPLWSTDPRTQIRYLAIRRFANQAAPELLGGMPFDADDFLDASDRARDVTPSQPLQEAQRPAATVTDAEPEPWSVCRENGEFFEARKVDTAVEALRRIFRSAAKQGAGQLATAVENNEAFLARLRDEGHSDEMMELVELSADLMADLMPAEMPQEVEQASQAEPAERPGAERADAPPADPIPEAREEVVPVATIQQPESRVFETPPPSPVAEAGAPSQTDERHDPFWDRKSLRLDPMPVRGGGNLKNLDWKPWPALILPKIRQAWSTPLLNTLWADNAELLDRYASAAGERGKDEIVAEFDVRRAQLNGEIG